VHFDSDRGEFCISAYAEAKRFLASPHTEIPVDAPPAVLLEGPMAAVLERGWRLRSLWVWRAGAGAHRRLKTIGAAAARSHAILPMEDDLRRRAIDGLDLIKASGGGDLVADYIVPMVQGSIFDLYGVPDGARNAFAAQLRVVRLAASEGHTQAIEPLFAIAAAGELLGQTLRHPAASGALSIRSLQAAIEAGNLSEDEAIAQGMVFLAGMETLLSAAGSLLARLSERPDIWASLQEDRTIVDGVIDEALRLGPAPDAPLRRVATEDVSLGTMTIPAGSRVRIHLNRANRDPAVFEDPDNFKLARQGPKHIAFGAGPHACAGLHLAYAQLRALLEALLDALPVWPAETVAVFSIGRTAVEALIINPWPAARTSA
jgi:cytochrome P450